MSLGSTVVSAPIVPTADDRLVYECRIPVTKLIYREDLSQYKLLVTRLMSRNHYLIITVRGKLILARCSNITDVQAILYSR